MIAECLDQAGLRVSDLNGVAVATGPGSFTGLRVGLAVAQGLALACNIPALGIDSFTACRLSNSASTSETAHYLIILESFRTELYWQLLDSDGKAITVPACQDVAMIMAALPAGPLLVIGDGAKHLTAALGGRSDCRILVSGGPDPAAIAREGERLLALGHNPPAIAFYVRPADAKPAQ
jgi:tRNA threonylcarbamoyladenosine biosynthesis protein TsaB